MRTCEVISICAVVMTVVLLLTATDSGSARPLAISTTLSTIHAHHSGAHEFSFLDAPHWQWSGGGVRGLSEGDENTALDNVSATLRTAFIDLLNFTVHDYDLQDISRAAPHSIAQLRRHVMSVAENMNKDCMIRMDPVKQLQCHLWGNHLNSAVSSALFSGVAVNSLCSLFLSCMLWKRGRHGKQLTPAFLQDTFRTLVRDDELLNSSQLMLRNVIHGGENWHEYPWLPNRLKVCEELIMTSSEVSAPIDVRAIFQGGDLTIEQYQGPNNAFPVRRLALRDNGNARKEFTRTLTSLEAMSVLYHRATNGGQPLPIVYPATRTQTECRTTAINMLLVSGDSLARQLFWRIVELLRRGPQGQVRVPYGSTWVNTNFRHFPTQRSRTWNDVVLVIYPAYDELHIFESLMRNDTVSRGVKYNRSTNTVHRFFLNVVAQRRRQHCGGGGDDHATTAMSSTTTILDEEEPLFYIVFLFDPVTSRPRTEALAPCLPGIPLSQFPSRTTHYFPSFERAAALGMMLVHDPPILPFRALGIRIPLHVHNANYWDLHESPTTYKWLERMATKCKVASSSSSSSSSSSTTSSTTHSMNTSSWIVGEHPTSDVTHLYRVETPLPHTIESMKRLRIAPPGRKARLKVNKRYVFQPTNFRLTRLETPFVWLRNTTAKRRHQDQHDNVRKPGVFFSKLRLLDMAKIMLASGNVIHTPDKIHEDCYGSLWLAGAAMFNKSAQTSLHIRSQHVETLAFALMQQQPFNASEHYPHLAFHPDSDCGGMGTLMVVNALLVDIVNSERRRSNDS